MRFALPLLAALIVAGCGFTEPFEYRADAFDRASPTFNRDPDPLTEVGFCYSGLRTPFEQIEALAEERCQAAGRQARFRGFAYDRCPALTPVHAGFDCILP